MPGESIDGLRKRLENFSRTGEIDPGFFARDFELHQSSSIVDTAGVFHGPEAANQSLDELTESFENLVFEPEELIEAPDGRIVVMIRAHARGRGSGIQLDNPIAWVFTIRDGQAARLDVYEERSDALRAAGLAA
jgi:ketosteroid isomerase-like protein